MTVSESGAAQPELSAGEPFRLPAELAASEDLTFRARAAEADGFPFDGDPQYERLFGQIARALCRRGAHHVLLGGERGVGKVTVLAELARRGACGRVPFLRDKRFVLADCRYTAPEESRQRLLALLSHVASYSQLILCIEGFGALLRTDRAGSNRGLLLSALGRVRCRIVGLVTPRDCEEMVSDDPDMLEFFTPVEVHEPDVETALKLLDHFAAGLAEKLRVTIDPQAVRRAVVLASGYILNERLPALSQIRHSKSNRPVFTPEFLARIKRIIVFRPLDKEAMHGIARKLVAEMQAAWARRRGKRLEVPEGLVGHVDERSHQVNEKSKGKEGGRIVRKLIAELIEAPVQRETSDRPDEYRACDAVVLEFAPPPEEGGEPEIDVDFVDGKRGRSSFSASS